MCHHRRIRLFAIAAAALTLAAACGTDPPVAAPRRAPADTDATLVADVERIAADALERQPLAALSVAVRREGRVVVAKGYGQADVEHAVAASPATVYEIGSITKQFTAVAVLQLAELGVLGLEDRLDRWLSEARGPAAGVTLAQLLGGTAGVRNYTDPPLFFGKPPRELTTDNVIRLLAAQPLAFPTGTRFAYSNSNYYLLGAVVERASGLPYDRYIAERVIAPAGLRDTSYCRPEPGAASHAQGYRAEGGALVAVPPPDMDVAFAAGALCSSALDLLTWQQALDENRVISAQSYGLMTTPAAVMGGEVAPYGFGVRVSAVPPHRVLSHDGRIDGFNALVVRYPDDDVTVVVLANGEGTAAEEVGAEIARSLSLLGFAADRAHK